MHEGASERRLEDSALEQRTLTVSLYGVAVVAIGSIVWGLALESDTVILNGIFTPFSLIGSGLSLAAAKVVTRPADHRFPFGHARVEPLVHCVNGMMMLTCACTPSSTAWRACGPAATRWAPAASSPTAS